MKLAVLTIAMCTVLAGAGCGGSGASPSGSTESSPVAAKTAESRTGSPKSPPKKTEPSSLVPKKAEPRIASPQGPPPEKSVIVKDLEKGPGVVAKTGDMLTVDFVGVYYNGKPLMSSWERHASFTFELGGGDGVLGWEKALQGMRVGGRRELILPARLTSRYLAPSERRSQIYVIDLRKVG